MSTENFEMNNKEEITPDGFLKLNLMEAQDPDGGTDELWVTIESMGYNKALELVKVSEVLSHCCMNNAKSYSGYLSKIYADFVGLSDVLFS